MTIKQLGGVFGRNPTFNDVTIEGELTFNGDIDVGSDLKVDGDLEVTGTIAVGNSSAGAMIDVRTDAGEYALRLENGAGGYFRVADGGLTEVGGNVKFTNAGSGIDFSATAGTGTSELFSDYEEGVWTPVIADSSSGGNTGTSLTAQGEYTKVGNVVYAKCTLVNVDTTGLTSATTAFIQGLPFASLNTTAASHDLGSCVLSRTTFTGFVTCGVPDNASSVRFMESATGVSYDYLDVSEFTSTLADIYFSVVYLAA